MSFTLGTLVSCKPQNAATFSIFTMTTSARNSSRQGDKFVGLKTHALLNNLNIIIADTNPPRPSEVPARLSWQVLDHNAAQDDELGVDAIEDAVVGEVETVCDFDGEPGCEFVISACSYDESVLQVFLQKSW
jgi:hypothetical protein